MKHTPLLLVFALTCVAGLSQIAEPSFVVGTSQDEAAIRFILGTEKNDQSQVATDLDWENAFGIRYTDERKRAAFYRAAVDPLQAQSKRVDLETRIKFVAPTIAIADVYGHRIGQIDTKTGKPGADRWLRNSYVLKKENGVWIEVAERIADLRYPWFKHYDALPVAYPVPPAALSSYAGRYSFSNHPGEELSVAGDHMIMMSKLGSKTLIPMSTTEFLAFDQNDLAQYRRITFGIDAMGTTTMCIANESGDIVATGTKMK